jgi:site-specific DNA-methyltransferase (adenine-specific)
MEPSKYAGQTKGMTFRHDGHTLEPAHKKEPVKAMKMRGNVWKYKVGRHHSSKDHFVHAHPAIFPEALAEDYILSWSNEGDYVFDPFMGANTTGKMAKMHNRKFIGIEIDKTYFDIAVKRIAES